MDGKGKGKGILLTEDECVVVEGVVASTGAETTNVLGLYGSVLTTKTVNGQALKSVMKNAWRTKRGFVFREVREKLTSAEYGKFVGYMKALKSKEMKISSVLQSIIHLFSTAERLPLLKRFKDYIAQKYRPLYEQHCASAQEDGCLKKEPCFRFCFRPPCWPACQV